jgi:branched-chain amino acid transport system ATP-binding protein
MLVLRDVTAGYGHFTALWGVSLEVAAGEAVAVVGPNGAGKTTLLRVISGVIAPRSGALVFEGQAMTGRPAHEVVARGIAHVPEGRRLFPGLTVEDNLKMGATTGRAWSACTPCSRSWPSGGGNGPAASRAASSRCWPSAAR